MDIDGLKAHIDEKFTHHEKVDGLIRKHHEQTVDLLTKTIDKMSDAIERSHERVDEVEASHNRLQTQIKTVKGVGATLATGLGAAAAWLGLAGK